MISNSPRLLSRLRELCHLCEVLSTPQIPSVLNAWANRFSRRRGGHRWAILPTDVRLLERRYSRCLYVCDGHDLPSHIPVHREPLVPLRQALLPVWTHYLQRLGRGVLLGPDCQVNAGTRTPGSKGLSSPAAQFCTANSLWDYSSLTWVGWRGGGYREGARSAMRRAITTVWTGSRKGRGSLAGYAQSPCGASTGAAGNGLEASARDRQPKRTYIGAKGTGRACLCLLFGTGVRS